MCGSSSRGKTSLNNYLKYFREQIVSKLPDDYDTRIILIVVDYRLRYVDDCRRYKTNVKHISSPWHHIRSTSVISTTQHEHNESGEQIKNAFTRQNNVFTHQINVGMSLPDYSKLVKYLAVQSRATNV